MTELATAMTPRIKVKESLVERLDQMRPEEERKKDWGREMSEAEWAALAAAAEKRRAKKGRGTE